jgi:NADH-quinone oxidoreductase subunit C
VTNDELKTIITEYCPAAVFEDGAAWLNIQVESADWLPLADALRNREDLSFDYLFCLTGVDWKTHLSVVYHLTSKKHQHTIVVKAKLAGRELPEIESVSGLWRTAEFHELEAYDLFGIRFRNHPGLRRLLLTDDWKGWPMRKDYEDPINIIKL